MEIYIDNQKIKIASKNKKDFEKILKLIIKRLEKKEKVIRNIYINGNALEENTVIDMNDTNILEVETKGYGDLIVESIENALAYIETFYEILGLLNYKIANQEKIEKEDIEEMHGFLLWFKDLLYLMEETYDLTIYNDFNSILEETDKAVEKLKALRKKKKYENYFKLLEIEILELLQKFSDNKKLYYGRILEEEKKKQLMA